jgi:hypothetical protein
MGGNFKEFIAIARYHKGRYFADAKLLQVPRLDFDTVDNRFNYGGNIYKDYDENRPLIACKSSTGNKTLFYSGYSRRLSSKPCH